MPVIVNGVELNDADMAAALAASDQSDVSAAMTALVLRRVLLDEAAALGLQAADEEGVIEALLAQQVPLPSPDESDCRRQYQAYPQRFTVGQLAEVSHILFQVTPAVDLAALRAHAETVLAAVLNGTSSFAAAAAANSNCPSAAVAGNLGQIARGACVPEFESAVFSAAVGAVIGRLVETRFGLHIIAIGRVVPGQLLPFASVQHQIASALHQAAYDRAVRQYLHLAVGRASISGIDLGSADSPLLQ
ncbi:MULTISPECIES: peptidylprolyl isomerase [unclassified Undibacterium]|uniref:peptidylprolyl isomerase n=1 Tax=unclassified Undibacterium TaxID=2630295 RepID=UPI002AC9AF70|nr:MULTISPECIES: peptidylprolyl isomerase [unclassified Undibacterium]MEB0138091.1 peptidylprolyl isomerase [Undibacterium sp. CCC2.1]MEB0171171.1 peptidylprolyl isomerase [Undibacterium sp. CCC1.1]MEB0175216.1 peptidylprolyl isomerase [Undibacterium sp. CCC3.4]MEB0214624.1 peptidylprolyl isomerase [Undibacterium sp. 5I2]WPX42392.1 peptidylprolyl isomerase [Undibacterium sp. CCC3.4]